MSDIIREAVYPHPPERVWQALTDPAALAAWLMPNDFKPQVGHKFQFRVPKPPRGWRGIVDCEVLVVAGAGAGGHAVAAGAHRVPRRRRVPTEVDARPRLGQDAADDLAVGY